MANLAKAIKEDLESMTHDTQGQRLEPCPFCGFEHPAWRAEIYGYDWIEYAVHCGNCDAESKQARDKADAAAAWNQRSDTAQLADAQRRAADLEVQLSELQAKLDGMSVRRDDTEDRFLGSTTWKGWKVDLYSGEEGDDE